MDVVSKNGNLLLNVGPKADGTISEEDTEILLQIGAWLEANGEAIYGSRVWRTAAEGPTKVEEGQFTDGKDKVFTKEDFRFTVKGSHLYAACLSYPEDGRIVIKSLAEQDASYIRLQKRMRAGELLYQSNRGWQPCVSSFMQIFCA